MGLIALRAARSPRIVPRAARWGWATIRRHGPRSVIRRFPLYLKMLEGYLQPAPRLYPRESGDSFGHRMVEPAEVPRLPNRLVAHPELKTDPETHKLSVSVVIPTYNAGPEFRFLLRKLTKQKGLGRLQIVIVDSGSSDRTVELAQHYDCKLVEISQTDFSHSFARNLGASKANGDYLLFMVQDAYPVGDYWINGIIGRILALAHENVIAVSCGEYCRTDSDLMYDCNVDTHYRFLRCREWDRVGELRGEDHLTLRAFGQLSNVTCLISRAVFHRYTYRGDYAEDLDLGIRLIRDGYKVAMLASVKTIHSHNRPAFYYLKRSFTDVVFLVHQFDDFEYPELNSLSGLLQGVYQSAAELTRIFEIGGGELDQVSEFLASAIRVLQDSELPEPNTQFDLSESELNGFLNQLRASYADPELQAESLECLAFRHGFIGRLEHFRAYAKQIYLAQDSALAVEVMDVLRKSFAATVGSYLGFLHLKHSEQPTELGRRIKTLGEQLGSGI